MRSPNSRRSQKNKNAHSLTREGGLVLSEPFEHPIVQIGEPQEAMRQVSRRTNRISGGVGRRATRIFDPVRIVVPTIPRLFVWTGLDRRFSNLIRRLSRWVCLRSEEHTSELQ